MTLPLTNRNLRYVVQFLRNSGERLRAIRLVVDVTGLDVRAAVKWVDGLHERMPSPHNRDLTIETL